MIPAAWRRILSVAGLALLGGCMNPGPPQVVVVGDVTPLGKQQAEPDAAHPVYYFPLPVGFKEMGALVAGEKAPPKHEVEHTLAVALAKRHYLVMNAEHPPEQLLVFWWGSMNPQIEDFGTNDPTQQVFFNEREMLALVGAYKSALHSAPWEAENLRSAARDDRYFVIIMAFDFAAARQHQKKLLWMAKMSTPSNGTNLQEVIPALVASGAPAFGRDTVPAVVDSGEMLKSGHVTLGPLELKETLPAKK